METKIQHLYQQKNKILNSNEKATQDYILKMKQNKQNKDYMIEKVYGTLKGFEKRIQNLSADNVKLMEENQTLMREVAYLKKSKEIQEKQQQSGKSGNSTNRRINISQIKWPSKNVALSVTPEEILSETNKIKGQSQFSINSQSEDESILTLNSEQFEQKMRNKSQQVQKINRLKYQMSMLKNKVKYLVMDFQ